MLPDPRGLAGLPGGTVGEDQIQEEVQQQVDEAPLILDSSDDEPPKDGNGQGAADEPSEGPELQEAPAAPHGDGGGNWSRGRGARKKRRQAA